MPLRDKTLPAHPRSPHVRYKTLPAHPFSPHVRYKTLPAHPRSPHVRYKTLPAHPPSPHVRYKTLPARPKWLNLALFLHAGRVLYRSDHQEAEQGEFCTEREADIERADTTAPRRHRCEGCRRNRRARPRCQREAATPAGDGKTTARQISHAIRLGQISTNPENVAIPTMQIQYLNKLRGNCMRN